MGDESRNVDIFHQRFLSVIIKEVGTYVSGEEGSFLPNEEEGTGNPTEMLDETSYLTSLSLRYG